MGIVLMVNDIPQNVLQIWTLKLHYFTTQQVSFYVKEEGEYSR
jgi:hypothetical protein